MIVCKIVRTTRNIFPRVDLSADDEVRSPDLLIPYDGSILIYFNCSASLISFVWIL